jgi:hypothetical protein
LDAFFVALQHAAAVGVIACLISESEIAAPIRDKLGWRVLYCPICLGFWIAWPTAVIYGPSHYLFVIALSNVWMLVILKVYAELDAIGDDDATSEVQDTDRQTRNQSGEVREVLRRQGRQEESHQTGTGYSPF